MCIIFVIRVYVLIIQVIAHTYDKGYSYQEKNPRLCSYTRSKEGENQIVIVKREHAERLGIYHCRHCGMAFEDEIQLSNHLRMHHMI
jgi:hypothetical protein